jgi:hypothetical protein
MVDIQEVGTSQIHYRFSVALPDCQQEVCILLANSRTFLTMNVFQQQIYTICLESVAPCGKVLVGSVASDLLSCEPSSLEGGRHHTDVSSNNL